MSRLDPTRVTLHLNVAVLACDSPTTLIETLELLKNLDVHVKRVGASAIAFPRQELPLIQRALNEHACFPRVINPSTPTEPNDD